MKPKTILFTLFALFSINMVAQPISVDKAKERVLQWSTNNQQSTEWPKAKRSALKAKDLTLAYTAKRNGQTCYYVFNQNEDEGFIVAGGDEIAENVLMCSESGKFDFNNINPNLKYWLECYEKEIALAKSQGVSIYNIPKRTATPKEERRNISHLVHAQWGQDGPFCIALNRYMGTSLSDNPYVTGCVATAMSMVMKYHRWPVTGIGSHTYFDEGSQREITRNFFEHTYAWDKMATFYYELDATYPAVDELMFDAGVSVNMFYRTKNEGGSGAYMTDISYAMVNFFGYDEGISHHGRNHYTDEEWDEMLYQELAAKRPVLYSGDDGEGGGHSFVCDGYRASDGMYYFNWGWTGTDNGYCRLSAVKAGGIPFMYNQDMIIGIQKPVEGSKAKPHIGAYADLGSCIKISETEENGLSVFTCYCDSFMYDGEKVKNVFVNESWKPFDCVFAMKYVNQENGESFIAKSDNDFDNIVSFGTLYPTSEWDDSVCMSTIIVKNVVKPQFMPSGPYRVYLVYRDVNNPECEWDIVRANNAETYWMEDTVEYDVVCPNALEASDISEDGFTAKWDAVEGVQSYRLYLTASEVGDPARTLIEEDFSGCHRYEDSDIYKRLDDYMKDPGWTGKKLYPYPQALEVGNKSVGGSITTPILNAKGKVAVIIDEYDTDWQVVVTVKIGNTKQTFITDGEEHVLFADVDGDFKVTISASGERQRFRLCYIKIATVEPMSFSQEFKDIEDTEYKFTGLDSAYIYSYKVKSVTKDGYSNWSNSVEVALGGDVTSIGEIKGTDIASSKILYDGTNIVVRGLKDGEEVSVYNLGGVKLGSGKSKNGIAVIPIQIAPGEVIICKPLRSQFRI